MSCVSWLSVGSQILGPFCSMLTGDHKYFCHKWEKILAISWTVIIFQRKYIFCKVYFIFENYIKFWVFLQSNHLDSSNSYFRSYWISKMWLLECPKGPVSEHPLVVNVLSGSKHCWSGLGRIVMLTFHEYQTNWNVYHGS